MIRLIPVAALVCLAAAPAVAAPKKEMATAKLLADVSAVQPGKPFHLGLLLEIEPGWHVYWKNPGDSGLPTGVKLKLPAGFEADEMSFPTPVRFEQPGPIVGYGYTEKVLHTIRVTPSADLKPGSILTLSAAANWLVCEKVCLPGRAQLEIALPVSDEAAPANAEVFSAWQSRGPVPAGQSPDVAEARVTPGGPGQLFEIIVKWKKASAKQVEFFPTAIDVLTVADVSVETRGDQTRVSFAAGVMQGQSLEVDSLPIVIGYVDEAGNRRGVEVNVPLKTLKTDAASVKRE